MQRRVWAVSAFAVTIGACSQPVAISGPLMDRENGVCIYVRGPYADSTDQYWVRSLRTGYSAGPTGILSPAGSVLVDGQSVTVTGTVSSVLGDTVCVSIHAVDVSSIR